MLTYQNNPLPLAYRWLLAHELHDFAPWEMIDAQDVAEALAKQYALEVAPPSTQVHKAIFPFMRRGDCDDIAGFVVRDGQLTETVLYVHLTWASEPQTGNYPTSKIYPSL